MIFETIALGLVCWFVTTIFVESEICRPIREWVNNRYEYSKQSWCTGIPNVKENGWDTVLWYKAKYIVGCQLCTGVWVGWVLAACTPWIAPISVGLFGILVNGLLYKAIGHMFLIVQKFMEAHT